MVSSAGFHSSRWSRHQETKPRFEGAGRPKLNRANAPPREVSPIALSMTLGSPLVSPGFPGSKVLGALVGRIHSVARSQARNVSKILIGRLAQALRPMFIADLLKPRYGPFQNRGRLAFVFDINVGDRPTDRVRKEPHGEFNPIQPARGARLWVREPGFDRNRHSC